MKKRLRKAKRKLWRGDPAGAFRALWAPHHSETRIATARAAVAAHLKEIHGNTVAHGPFQGMRLADAPYWGQEDVSAKILGTYERQVTDRLVAFADPEGLLVDLGSADGYFAIGAVRAGLFPRCLCFERSEKGRAMLAVNARANGVADRIEIHGEASSAGLRAIVPAGTRGVVLSDIEGGEFEVFDSDLLAHLARMHVIVELHDFLVPDGAVGKAALTDRATERFRVSFVRSVTAEISDFPELDDFDDNHRLLALSEGRDRATVWMVLEPKAAHA